jgi:hypothetical protein
MRDMGTPPRLFDDLDENRPLERNSGKECAQLS